MLLQKTYTSDFRSKKKKNNHGEVRQYYVEHSHEPIIDRATFEAVQRERDRRAGFYVSSRSTSRDKGLFVGMIICGFCGSRYRRKHFCGKYGKTGWICYQFLKKGKEVCPSQVVPESVLVEKTKAILKTDELTSELLEQKLHRIIVSEHNHLTYQFKDGDSIDVFWEHPSRNLSWTPEMKENARQRANKQHGKEKK